MHVNLGKFGFPDIQLRLIPWTYPYKVHPEENNRMKTRLKTMLDLLWNENILFKKNKWNEEKAQRLLMNKKIEKSTLKDLIQNVQGNLIKMVILKGTKWIILCRQINQVDMLHGESRLDVHKFNDLGVRLTAFWEAEIWILRILNTENGVGTSHSLLNYLTF